MMKLFLKLSSKFGRHTFVLGLEIFGAVLLLGAALILFLTWRFSQGPVDLTFAQDYVRSALIARGPDTDLKFATIKAEWPNFGQDIRVKATGVALTEKGKTVFAAPSLDIKLSKFALLFGVVRPQEITVEGAIVRLTRARDGQIHMLLQDQEENPSPDAADMEADNFIFAKSFRDLGESFFLGGTLPDYPQIEPLSDLNKISVRHSLLVFEDKTAGGAWRIPDIDFDVARKKNEFTFALNYHHRPGDKAADKSSLAIHLVKDKNRNVLFDVLLQNVSPGTFLPFLFERQKLNPNDLFVTGEMRGQLDAEWNVSVADMTIGSDSGTFTFQGFDDTPVMFSKLAANVHYDGAQKIVSVHKTQMDVNGRTVLLDGQKKVGKHDPIFPLHIAVAEIALDDIHDLWPVAAQGTVLADWLTRRLSGGVIHNFDMTLPINIDDVMALDPEKIVAKLEFEKLDVDYQTPMIPVKNAKGTARYAGDRLDIDIQDAALLDMDVREAQVSIEHLAHPTKVGDVTITAKASGKISSVLAYVATPPIALTQEKTGLSPEAVKGQGEFSAQVVFPALKDLLAKDVKVDVQAELSDVVLPHIVKGLDLTGGPYDLNVTGGSFTLAGKGKIGGEALDLTYSEYINPEKAPYQSRVEAALAVTPALRKAFAVDLSDLTEDAFPVHITYQSAFSGAEQVDVRADVTPATLRISPLKFVKAAGLKGDLSCMIELQDGEVRTVKNIMLDVVGQGKAKGTFTFGKFGAVTDVKTGKFTDITLGGKNNFSLDFSRPKADHMDVKLYGKVFDARNFLGGNYEDKPSGKGKTSTYAASVSTDLDQIIMGDAPGQVLLDPALTLKVNRVGEITFLDLTGKADGVKVEVSLKPDASGLMSLSVDSPDAGKALRTFGLYDHVQGGVLWVRGRQMAGGALNDIRGQAQISKFTVVKAPVLAKLINLFSISGLAELLQNKGIAFDTLKMDFDWKTTSAGRVISVQNGRTSGSSIGLTFGGHIYQSKGTIDMSGTFVPMSQINSFVAKIPLLGGLLTGGKNGGIIAATYSMKGPSEDPNVIINPLSVLTPGFLRSIFFEDDNSVDSDYGAPPEKPRSKQGYNR